MNFPLKGPGPCELPCYWEGGHRVFPAKKKDGDEKSSGGLWALHGQPVGAASGGQAPEEPAGPGAVWGAGHAAAAAEDGLRAPAGAAGAPRKARELELELGGFWRGLRVGGWQLGYGAMGGQLGCGFVANMLQNLKP